MRFSYFFWSGVVLAALGHLYMYRRLVRDVVTSRRGRLIGLGVVAALFTASLVGRQIGRGAETEAARALVSFAWLWLGTALYLVLALLVGGAVSRLISWRQSRRGAPHSPERRQFLSLATAGAATAAGLGVAGYGLWRAYHPAEITEVAIRLRGLPRTLDGFTIVQTTDIHVAPLVQRKFMDAMVEQINSLRPDLSVITGDLVDGRVSQLGSHVSALSNTRARYGSYFVTGNHEYGSGEVAWTEALEKMGIRVLRNRHVSIGEGRDSFDLIGVDDWSGKRRGPTRGGYDLEKATAGRDPARAAVLLAHQPRGWEDAAAKGVGLQLSGHTHGGQMFPFTLLIDAMWDHSAGLYSREDSHLYVSRGTGFWGPPFRVGSPPELVKIVLVAA